jgi:hypothetical protein
MRAFAAFLVLFAVGAAPAFGGPVTISEVYYDAPGGDNGQVFVELYGPAGMSLSGWRLEGINGSGGGTTHSVDLSPFAFPADGFLVVADSSGGVTGVPGADVLVADFDLQNGPDSVELFSGSVVADAVGYGSFPAGTVFAGEGSPAPDVDPGFSLARNYANVDTGDNAVDFYALESPTPGSGAVKPLSAPTPEPLSLVLFGAGLLLMALCLMRR